MRNRNLKGQFTSIGLMGKNNPKWKGDLVGYYGLHTWVRRILGKPTKCSFCLSKSGIQWANKSKKYRRNTHDWLSLCRVCHRSFDGITKLTKETANEIRQHHVDGERQRSLARRFKVSQTTVSNIVLGRTQFYV